MSNMIAINEEDIDYDYFDEEVEDDNGNDMVIKLCDIVFTVTAEQANEFKSLKDGMCEYIKIYKEDRDE